MATKKVVKKATTKKAAPKTRPSRERGLVGLLGSRVTLFCLNYIYTGTLVQVGGGAVELADAGIVYETGGLLEPSWKDMQKLPGAWYVSLSAIESFGILK
jgi:hypothetical protein